MAEIPDDLKDLLGVDEEYVPIVSDGDALTGAVFSGPAPLANRFMISGHPGVVRIGFAEQYDNTVKPHFRSAVTLTTYNAAELVSILRAYLLDQINPSDDEGGGDVEG